VTTPVPCRYELGQLYENTDLRPGVVVVRPATLERDGRVRTPVPCCCGGRRLPLQPLTVRLDVGLYRQLGAVCSQTQAQAGACRGASERCRGCGWPYRVRLIEQDGAITAAEWEVGCP